MGTVKALQARGLTLAAEGTYPRNTTAVKTALLSIRKADPEAIVMVGTYKPIAEFIRLARQVSLTPTFVTLSFVGSEALAAELGDKGEGVIISQVVPSPSDETLPLVAAYRKALAAEDGEAGPSFISLEGYLAGRLFVAAADKAGPELTREGLINAIRRTGTFDLGGLSLTFRPDSNQGLDHVFLTVIQKDGSLKQVDRLTR